MSKILINQYYNNLDRAIQFGKSVNEQSVRNHFWNLLNNYARKQNFEVVTEVSCLGTKGKKVWPDGIVKNLFGLDIGLWESKDEKDSIDDEIEAKRKKGYPFTNILFEDTQTAILFQRGEEAMRVPVRDAEKLNGILTAFVSFKSEYVYRFEDALQKFKADIPVIVETLRNRIDETSKQNRKFIAAGKKFLELCRAEVNPEIAEADVREMMIQHILTSDIFNKIFDDPEFHRHNNIARELESLIEILFTYSERRNLLGNIEHYYDAINAAAAGIPDHHEKQKFLKVLYENFYKVYNPKAADRLGVVYTPNEIVQFMIESTDQLLYKHFGKTMADENVEILDPATGTGTFITSIIDHIPTHRLAYKYQTEIHANEVAILPYYVANLNIEFTYKQRMSYYEEFKNLCFVDTLDNYYALNWWRKSMDEGMQSSMFAFTTENSARIKRQNTKKISVIVGNPPYNANQKNENENNRNRNYIEIDKRIKNTYVKHSAAHKMKVYDMYARFYRWASDRLNQNGIIAFITNNSFIDSRTFDGFRKCISDEFDYAYIIDLGGNIRKLSGKDGIFLNEEHTIFGVSAAVGIAIMFLIKKETPEKQACQIHYIHPCDIRAKRSEKIAYLVEHSFADIPFTLISPDKGNNWVDITENDFDSLSSLVIGGGTKLGKSHRTEVNSIYDLFSFGIVTNRDDWVYDLSKNNLRDKVQFLIKTYNSERSKIVSKTLKDDELSPDIKWTQDLKNLLRRNTEIKFAEHGITTVLYRPFFKCNLYLNKQLNWSHYQILQIFPHANSINRYISFTAPGSEKPFMCIVGDQPPDLHLTSAGTGAECIPLYRYNSKGDCLDNITDWGLNLFRKHYKDQDITKEAIFNYTYAVLYNPAYRDRYEVNLKREFPRLPFYHDFWKWAKWGEALMDLHINYETVNPFSLKLVTTSEEKPSSKKPIKLKVKLRANKETGTIELDEGTSLTGVPREAWDYKLGNRSALEWVLDQYKEKKPKDPTVAEKFNTYCFADYKKQVIDLLKRVCTVSVETMKIVGEMDLNTTTTEVGES